MQILFTNIFYTFQRYILHVLLTTEQWMRMICWNKRSFVIICRHQLFARYHLDLWYSPVTTNKINGALGKNVVVHHQFIIILPLYALNNKNTPVAFWAKHVISAWQSMLNDQQLPCKVISLHYNYEVDRFPSLAAFLIEFDRNLDWISRGIP